MDFQKLSNDVYVMNGMTVATAPGSTAGKTDEQIKDLLLDILREAAPPDE
jgi:hypothetical protein